MNPWLEKANSAFESSTNYIDQNYRKHWENALRMFQSRHRAGSKYYSDAYKYRSKLFRPKTRSAIRGNEAGVMNAFFSNMDVVSIDPIDPNNPVQVVSAMVHKELLNVRFNNHIKWFKICIGASQDAQVIGIVASLQDWDKEKDSPRIILLPVENIRFSPNADWLDPVNSSPYFIILRPMYVMDVKEKMESGDFKKLSDDVIASALDYRFDSTAQTREEDKVDKNSRDVEDITDFDVVWVHQNFIRKGSEDKVFFTLSTKEMLTDPVPIEEMYFHGERPVVIGEAVIEAHRAIPTSYASMGEPIQTEINEIANQRADNVKLVLNKRYKVKRGSQVDLKSLLRNVAGGVTMTNDPHTDIVAEEFQDITGSSYMEHDRLNVDFDELMGVFSPSSVQTNRRMNETVGGMGMLQGTSHGMTEYFLRTFGETWAEPVIRQVVKLEQYYETDINLLAIIGNKLKDVFQQYRVDGITDHLLNQDLSVTVNVGAGAADPNQRLQRLLAALKYVSEIYQSPVPGINMEEVIKEIFGILGYRDGKRFVNFTGEMPVIKQLQGVIQELQKQIGDMNAQLQNKEADRQIKMAQTVLKERAETERKHLDSETTLRKTQLESETDLQEAHIKAVADTRGKVIDARSRQG